MRPHVYAIHETDALKDEYEFFCDSPKFRYLSKEHQETLDYLMGAFEDAKETGSLIELEKRDYEGLKKAWTLVSSKTPEFWSATIEREIPYLINQAIVLSQKYHAVVTNP
ncbi:MAG: hypothetical protein ACOX0A_07210 [Thermoguttaceae bacterium]|jgi:hypothetical protein